MVREGITVATINEDDFAPANAGAAAGKTCAASSGVCGSWLLWRRDAIASNAGPMSSSGAALFNDGTQKSADAECEQVRVQKWTCEYRSRLERRFTMAETDKARPALLAGVRGCQEVLLRRAGKRVQSNSTPQDVALLAPLSFYLYSQTSSRRA
jgi:hypothetical protein